MFPCPVHNELDSESRANVIRRSKLARDQGVEVKWMDHEILESMIIINPPTKNNPNPDDGIALIDLSLPHLDTPAGRSLKLPKNIKARYFPTWSNRSASLGKAIRSRLREKKEQDGRTKLVLKGTFVGL